MLPLSRVISRTAPEDTSNCCKIARTRPTSSAVSTMESKSLSKKNVTHDHKGFIVVETVVVVVALVIALVVVEVPVLIVTASVDDDGVVEGSNTLEVKLDNKVVLAPLMVAVIVLFAVVTGLDVLGCSLLVTASVVVEDETCIVVLSPPLPSCCCVVVAAVVEVDTMLEVVAMVVVEEIMVDVVVTGPSTSSHLSASTHRLL